MKYIKTFENIKNNIYVIRVKDADNDWSIETFNSTGEFSTQIEAYEAMVDNWYIDIDPYLQKRNHDHDDNIIEYGKDIIIEEVIYKPINIDKIVEQKKLKRDINKYNI